jgi:uncharacterized protein (TIGR02145 family)
MKLFSFFLKKRQGSFIDSLSLINFLFIALIFVFSFGCKKSDSSPPPTYPTVTTTALTNINSNGATAGGTIVSNGNAAITQSGIVWSKTNTTPSLTDSMVAGTTSSGSFTTNLTNLNFNTVYYIRAFATNSVGTGYGNVVTLNTANDTSKVQFTYNGKVVTYGIIISQTTGKKWLDRNLGATQVATAVDDYKAYGDLFQWGRPADRHQLINWTSSTAGTPVNGVTMVLATSDFPGQSNFIGSDTSADWRNDQNRNRWNTVPQGSCPEGWHVPNHSEWAAEIIKTPGGVGTATNGGMSSQATAYSQLKLTIGGYRLGYTDGSDAAGTLRRAGTTGYYWSSDDYIDPGAPYPLGYEMFIGPSSADLLPGAKTWGFSIRCIKN